MVKSKLKRCVPVKSDACLSVGNSSKTGAVFYRDRVAQDDGLPPSTPWPRVERWLRRVSRTGPLSSSGEASMKCCALRRHGWMDFRRGGTFQMDQP